MATKKTETVEALVLVDCGWGKIGTIVVVDAQVARDAAELDPAPAAVAHAKTKE